VITSINQLIYSVSAARRIFAIPSGVRVRIIKFWRCIWLWVAGQRPRFVSLAVFKAHFAQRRMQAAQQLTVSKLEPYLFTVTNPVKAKRYAVVLIKKGPVCECEDYRNQAVLLGKGVCKHGYAVLAALGFGSLSAYLSR
jgi:predicted nucleic acid-binding Zn finger protein